jgi:hypothetical protein
MTTHWALHCCLARSVAGLLVCVVALAFATLTSPVAWANTPQASPSLPASVNGLDKPLVFRAQSRYSFLGFEVYDASLWTPTDFNPALSENQALALELHYLRNFSGQDIAKRSMQEMRKLAAVTPAQEQQWMKEMRRVFPNVRQGDRLLGVHRAGQSAAFWHNGKPVGDIADAAFARLFFGIWLSPKTSAPALRQALIGPALPSSPSDQQVKAP